MPFPAIFPGHAEFTIKYVEIIGEELVEKKLTVVIWDSWDIKELLEPELGQARIV